MQAVLAYQGNSIKRGYASGLILDMDKKDKGLLASLLKQRRS
jgi:hypothetical protein